MMARSRDEDPFAPPAIPTEVECLHCGEVYDSWRILWQEDETCAFGGHWCCPTPGCGGLGFLFDIWPTDPEWRDENGELVCDPDAEDSDEYDDLFEDDEELIEEQMMEEELQEPSGEQQPDEEGDAPARRRWIEPGDDEDVLS